MFIIFFVILTNLIGFGIMIPIFVYYALRLGSGPEMATFCVALYGVGTLISTPILGRLSDYYGRKPILILSMLGASMGYLLLGFSESIYFVALSRLFSGLMAGNVAAAQAYVTDITTEKNRAKGMGIIGAALGLGFIIGAALGSYLAGDSFETANLFLPAMVSAGLSMTAFFLILFFLPESLHKKQQQILRKKPKISQWQALQLVSKNQLIVPFLIGNMLYNISTGFVESIFPIWIKDTAIAFGPQDLMPLLLVAGSTLVIIQGGLIGPLSRTFGEYKLLKTGTLLFSISTFTMILAGYQSSYYSVMAVLCLQSIAAALIITSMQSMVSIKASTSDRGLVLGVYSSAGTFGRILGTLFTGLVYANLHIHAPFLLAGLCTFLLLYLSFQMKADI